MDLMLLKYVYLKIYYFCRCRVICKKKNLITNGKCLKLYVMAVK